MRYKGARNVGRVNVVVSSQRLMLSFYTLPTLFSAYFFGRRHATMTAIFSALVVGGVAYSNPKLFEPAVVAPFDYASILYVTVLGYAIWGDLPDRILLLGAVIVVASGLYIVHRESRRGAGRIVT